MFFVYTVTSCNRKGIEATRYEKRGAYVFQVQRVNNEKIRLSFSAAVAYVV